MSGTLVEVLREQAQREPDRVVFTWLEDGEREAGTRSFGELDARARAIGARLSATVAPGERALLLYDQGLGFIDAFLGCLYAGVIPVPTAAEYVRPEAALARLEPIVADATPAVLMTDGSGMAVAALHSGSAGRGQAPRAAALAVVETAQLEPSDGWEPARATPDDLAFLQYTSGSTGTPRGVMVSHGNLIANLEMWAHIRSLEQTVVVSWVPMFHDLGLVAMTLMRVYDGSHCITMSPVAFVLRPVRWLEAITRYRADGSGGPNFAYDLCVRRIPEAAREGLDLSCWRRAFSGGEPVRADTIDRFAAEFGPFGFDGSAFAPGYGMAEATVLATGTRAGGARTVTLDPAALQEDRLEFPDSFGPGRRLVSCGPPAAGVVVEIVDPERAEPLGEDRIGEIWVAGPNVTPGYWERPEETREVFGNELPGAEGKRFVRSGDVGFLHEGELYVTGRIKDLIIVRGRNHHPGDIELTAERSHPGLRPGGGAAFSIGAGEERVILVHEVRPAHAAAVAEITAAVRSAVAQDHGLTLHELVCIPPGRLRKTTSGKTMRQAMRGEYLAGELHNGHRSA